MEHGVSTAQYFEISSEQELEEALGNIPLPVIIKATDLQGAAVSIFPGQEKRLLRDSVWQCS